jgi:hypothetical protein
MRPLQNPAEDVKRTLRQYLGGSEAYFQASHPSGELTNVNIAWF